MDDYQLEILALTSVILGLLVGYFFVFDFSQEDGFYLNDEDIVYFKGNVMNSFETENGMVISLIGCREVSAYYEGGLEVNIGDNIRVEGSMSDGFVFAEHVFIE